MARHAGASVSPSRTCAAREESELQRRSGESSPPPHPPRPNPTPGDRNVALRFPARPQRARPIIAENQRVYSDAEFALILRKATELATPGETSGQASDGLTLAQIKAAAAEAGIDPALVERAARLLPANASASPFERLMGGPVRHDGEIHVPVTLDEAGAARLLSAVQLSAGQPGTGHSSAIGMVWHARDEGEPFSVTAQPEEGGTSVAVRLDRRDTMASIQAVAAVGLVGATTAGFVVASQVGLELGAVAGVCGMGGILALGRLYWTSSTRRARERISGMIDAVGRAMGESGDRPTRIPPER